MIVLARILLLFALWPIVPVDAAPPSAPQARTGVMVTPRNFPAHGAADVEDMFRLAAQLGSFSIVRLDWKDPKLLEAARVLAALAERHGQELALELNPLRIEDLEGATVEPPPDDQDDRRPSFASPRLAQAFERDVLALARLRPAYLGVAVDVNLLETNDAGSYAALSKIYRRLYDRVKQLSPSTRVYASFRWEPIHRAREDARRKIERFGPMDLAVFTTDPHKLFAQPGPGSLPEAYYDPMGDAAGSLPLFVQATWPSDGRDGEADQARFIRELPRRLAGARPAMVGWLFLHDVKVLMFFTARAGLLTADGKPKRAHAAFRELAARGGASTAAAPGPAARGASAALGTAPRSPVGVARKEPAHFGIYTARLDGSGFELLIASDTQEMTHPRVSPDGRRVVITRYNRRDRQGRATEEVGYEDTEILVMNLDGTGLEVVVPMKPGVMAANGTWSPDGNSIVYLSTDNAKRVPEIRRIDLATRRITRMPTPAGLKTTDPHLEAGKLAFAVKADGLGADALWVMDEDGSNARQVTFPKRGGIMPGLYGDFDPRISPDGRKIASMRNNGGASWRVFVVDLATGEETMLTPEGKVLQWLPSWSSDGKRLLYVHVDFARPREIGLYTMTPEGNDRRKVPLPGGRFYGHSSWFPNDGSSERARIIFNGTVNPKL